MRILLLALAALALLAPAADASTQRLSKDRAHEKAERVLGADQVAYLFDVELIRGWVVEPADRCGRLSQRRVRCAFAVTLSDGTECGATLTMIRWRANHGQPAYIGWIISTHPLEPRCDTRAAQQADVGRPRRGIQDWLG